MLFRSAACRAAGRPQGSVALLAVSKTHPVDAVWEAHAFGQRAFGENRVQELTAKAAACGTLQGLQWHMIGSLQTNKVRDLVRVPGLALLHSLDRISLADELQRELQKQGRNLDTLLEIHATGEATKHGCAPADAQSLLEHVQRKCPSVRVRGLMAMGPLGGDPRPVFAAVAELRERLRASSGLQIGRAHV